MTPELDVSGEAIVGLPTLMAIFDQKLQLQPVLDALGGTGHPLQDVSIYYRVHNTDQVIDASTGHVAAGQALEESDLTQSVRDHVQTVVLLHPGRDQAPDIQSALSKLGNATFMYESKTKGETTTDAPLPHDELRP